MVSSIGYSQNILDAKDFQSNFSSSDFYLGKQKTVQNPKGMDFDHLGQYLFIANMWGPTPRNVNLTVMSANSMEVIKEIPLPNGYYSKSREHANGHVEVAITEDNQFVLATLLQSCGSDGCNGVNTHTSEKTGNGLLNVINMETMEPVLYIPTGGQGAKVIGVKPGSSKVYVTNWFSNNVGVIDIKKAYQSQGEKPKLDKRSLVKIISFPKGATPRGVAFSDDGRYMYVTGFNSKRLYVIDTDYDRIIATTPKLNGVNLRHVVVNRDATIAYFSHLRGDGISRIDLTKLNEILKDLNHEKNNLLPSSIWEKIFIPWRTRSGTLKNILVLKDYPLDHPEIPGKIFNRANPNTIVLDKQNECYLYVSFRSAGITGQGALLQGKVDIIDVCNDRRVISLLSGQGPTALATTEDGKLLASAGFFDHNIYFFDIASLKSEYEKMYEFSKTDQ